MYKQVLLICLIFPYNFLFLYFDNNVEVLSYTVQCPSDQHRELITAHEIISNQMTIFLYAVYYQLSLMLSSVHTSQAHSAEMFPDEIVKATMNISRITEKQ